MIDESHIMTLIYQIFLIAPIFKLLQIILPEQLYYTVKITCYLLSFISTFPIGYQPSSFTPSIASLITGFNVAGEIIPISTS